jgi:hypothetical protein
LVIITVLGCVSYGLRVGGYLAAGSFPTHGRLARLLRLAPGNLFVAFTAAAVWQGHWPAAAGSLSTVAVMAVTRKEWAALAAGFLMVAAVSR